ncbi:glutamine amidotransferase-like protein [Desulfurococcus mucosus DSM 2162]|uniref:Glutamine amidotransferase-like protein n=2 Tax=Desulfurococcus mucosus TaxID=2275 RepID=E8RA02_DESM0|nr:glutamine amidotransferase-like protein [Desulfurococcus mucosus DSM 2162]
MCRLLAAWLRDGMIDSLNDVLHAFAESSRFDPYLEKVSSGKSREHDDGWGVAAVGYGGNPSVVYQRMLEPIYSENSLRILDLVARRLRRYSEVYVLIHARKSSRNEPYGQDYTHPFMRLMDNGALWFAHNGGADKEALARVLGVYPWVRVDSELLGYFIMGLIDECVSGGGGLDECVGKAYAEGLRFIPGASGYNTGLLALVSKTASLYVSHKVLGNPSPELAEYYRIISYASREAVLAGSITIREYMPGSLRKSLNEGLLEPGVYRIGAGGLTRVASL